MVGNVFNICLSPFLWTGTTFDLFHSTGNVPLSKQDWKINFRVLQIKVSDVLIIRIIIISCLWALFGSRILIIFRILSFEKFMVDKDSEFQSYWKSTLVTYNRALVRKKIIENIGFFFEISNKLSWCSSGRMQEVFYYSERFLISTSIVSALP